MCGIRRFVYESPDVSTDDGEERAVDAREATENDEAPAVAISSPNEFVGLFRTAMKSSGLPIEIIDVAALYALNQLIPEAVPGGL